MKRNSLYLIVCSALCLSTALTLISCGGDGGSDDGDLLIQGNVSDTIAGRSARGLEGYLVSALGTGDITDADGQFELFGDTGNVPAQTVLTLTALDGGRQDLVLNTSGTPPFTVAISINPDGTAEATVTDNENSESGDQPAPVPSAAPTVVPTPEEPSDEPSDPPAPPEPTATPAPDETPFDESQDCFCDNGFGPVAPSFTCPDTGAHPTDCRPGQ